MTYQPGIPTGTVNLDVDYQNLQNNFQQLDTQFGVDHIPFSNTSGTPPTGVNGYHTNIHLNPFSTTVTNPPNNYSAATASPAGAPLATSGFGQLFSSQINDGLNVDESLFWLTGGNRMIQLCRNIAPLIGARGYTSIPGGLIVQWGRVTLPGGSSASATITFASGGGVAFPNNCFFVLCSLICAAGGTGSSDNTICVRNSVTRTQFIYQYNGNGGTSYPAFYWFALGN